MEIVINGDTEVDLEVIMLHKPDMTNPTDLEDILILINNSITLLLGIMTVC